MNDPRFPGIIYRYGASSVATPVLRGTGLRVQTLVIDVYQTILFGIAIDDVVNYDFSDCNQVVVWNPESLPTSGTSFFRAAPGGGETGYSGQRRDPNRRRTPDHNE